MPTSSLEMIPLTVHHMWLLDPGSVLDIGAGFGKYGVLFRECCAKHPRVEAIEAWQPYIDAHRLCGIYDAVHATDVMLATDQLLNSCDAVYMGDVIEHLTKHDGHALLQRIRCPIVINTPEHFFDNPPDLPWTETHRSHWTLDDFRNTGRVQREDVHLGGLVITLGPA